MPNRSSADVNPVRRSVTVTRPRTAKSFRRKHPWRRQWRYWYLRLIRLQGSPASVARGLAAGSFSGMFPLFGMQIFIGVILATLLKGNRLAAAAATWISNPFTYIPLFAFNYKVGQLLVPEQAPNIHIHSMQLSTLLELGSEILHTLFLGCFVMGSIVSVCSYFAGRRLITHLRRQRKRY